MPRSDLRIQIDEQSPLLRRGDSHGAATDSEQPSSQGLGSEDEMKSKPWWYLLLLTISIGGLQIVWSVELGSGSPYLLSLGLNKSILAFVWIAGPLTGVLVQPYVGIRSDNCRISWGRRKPFMIGGAIATIISLLALSRARDIVGGLNAAFGGERYNHGVKVGSIVFATAFMYVLDFAINTVQAAIRAFIVDNAPAHQQEEANAWASRITGMGNVVGYVFGYIDLPRIFPILGKTQFEVLCVLASLALAITLVISCLTIPEQDPNVWGPPDLSSSGFVAFFRRVFKSVRGMQPQVKKVCQVQLANWMGWFPFLYYITTFIGQLYVNPHLERNQKDHDLTSHDIDRLWQEGTRVGTFALLIYAVASFASNVILPFLVVPTYKDEAEAANSVDSMVAPTSPIGVRPRTPGVKTPGTKTPGGPKTPGGRPTLPLSYSAASLSSYFPLNMRSSTVPRKSRLVRFMEHLRIPGLTLRRLWMFAQILFAICMFSTFFIRTPILASVMTAFVGISWSVTLWAPFALISAEIARSAEKRRREYIRKLAQQANEEDGDGDGDNSTPSSQAQSPAKAAAQNDIEEGYDEEKEEDEVTDQAGIILGLHNVAISAPQLLATLISSAVFKALQKPRGTPGDDSVGWVLRMAGIAALVAAYLTSRLREPREEDDE